MKRWGSLLRFIAYAVMALLGLVWVIRFGGPSVSTTGASPDLVSATDEATDEPAPNADADADADADDATTRRRTKSKKRVLRIGWTAWADAELVTHLAKRLLEERMDQPVELVMADIGIQYQGLLGGDLDIMLMAWLPTTHARYWDRVAKRVLDLGPLYTGARLGWAVPAYVPEAELSSIADLSNAAVREKIGGEIQGIDPGSGLMQASERALNEYNLPVQLVASSGAAMTAALDRAIRKREWIVVTAWNPHWMFARWDLRVLDDPRAALGKKERVHALARAGFYEDFDTPITNFFARMFLPIDELERALLYGTDHSLSETVEWYVQRNERAVRYWVSGAF